MRSDYLVINHTGSDDAQLPAFTLAAEPARKVIPWWDYNFDYAISVSPTNLPYSVTLFATAVMV
jgi:hypothetical protein